MVSLRVWLSLHRARIESMTDDLQPDPPATQDDLPENGRRWLAVFAIVVLSLLTFVMLSVLAVASGDFVVTFQ